MMGEILYGSPPPLIRPPFCNEKNGLIREVTTLDGANLVVFTTKFISSEIRHDKKGNLVEGALKERDYCTCNKTFTLSVTLYREGCFNFDEITVYVYCLP